MIVEIDTNLLSKLEGISINQLIFLSCIINQTNQTKLRSLFSLMNSNEIQDMIEIGYVKQNPDSTFSPTSLLLEKLGKKEDYFKLFYDTYPVVVVRPDNTRDYLRVNVNKCRKLYNQLVGNSLEMHKHLIKCLEKDLDDKAMNGKLCYMPRMWKWLTNREWESVEQSLTEATTQTQETIYGTDIKW